MRTRRIFSLLLLMSSVSAYVFAADEVTPISFTDLGAGQKISIPGTFTDEGVRKVLLVVPGKKDSEALEIPADPIGEDKKVLTFVIPNNAAPGWYFVKVKLGEGTPLYAGELRVAPPAEVQVAVTTVRPLSSYPNPNPVGTPVPTPTPAPAPGSGPAQSPTAAPKPTPTPNQYNFEIAGTNFSRILENNHIEIDEVPIETPPCKQGGPIPCLGTEDGNETRKLIVYHYSPRSALRPLSVGVRVGDSTNVAKSPNTLIFSSVSERRLRAYAFGAFALLILILFLFVGTGLKVGKIDKEKFGSIKAFLLDRETNSYSLSKLQLTIFTLTSVFGYIYVFVCTLWVQGKFEMPPVPENLPGMMAISVGTSVVAAGIGAKIGGKGAGPTSPSLADFITSGGVVLPERFQFFLWTIVSAGGVLALILAADPVTLSQLPKLPEGMLYLMGLSSAGYLGGKLVRGPGPSIKSLDAKLLSGNVVQFILHGDNLSSKATFELDNVHIPSDQVQIGEKTQQGQTLDFNSMLEVKLSNIAQRYFDGPHLFRIVNPDSQGADFKFGATLEAVTATKEGDPDYSADAANFIVTGTNFKDPSSAQWIDAAGNVTKLGPDAVTKNSDTELVVSLPAGSQPAKISILSPGGLSTTFDLESRAHADTPTAAPPTIASAEIAKVDVPEKPSEGGKPAEPAYTALEIALTGDNLSPEASFQLDGEIVPADQVIVVDKSSPSPQDPKLCTMLKVHLKGVDSRFYEGPRVLRITNPHSSGTDIQFGSTVEPVTAGDTPTPVSVTGANFGQSVAAAWTNASGSKTTIPAANIQRKSDTELEVTLIPGPAGVAKLTITNPTVTSPGGITSTVDVTVVEAQAGEEEQDQEEQQEQQEEQGQQEQGQEGQEEQEGGSPP